jgi:hypothetical protein
LRAELFLKVPDEEAPVGLKLREMKIRESFLIPASFQELGFFISPSFSKRGQGRFKSPSVPLWKRGRTIGRKYNG